MSRQRRKASSEGRHKTGPGEGGEKPLPYGSSRVIVWIRYQASQTLTFGEHLEDLDHLGSVSLLLRGFRQVIRWEELSIWRGQVLQMLKFSISGVGEHMGRYAGGQSCWLGPG